MNLITIDNGQYHVSSNSDDALAAERVDHGFVVSLYDPQMRVGGLLRFAEPDSRVDVSRSVKSPALYADSGLAALVADACLQGADKRRMIVWIVGGADITPGADSSGKKNYIAARKNLWKIGLCINSEAVGGSIARDVRLEIGSGTCSVTDTCVPQRVPSENLTTGDLSGIALS